MGESQALTWTIIRQGLVNTPHRNVLGASMMRNAAVAAIFRHSSMGHTEHAVELLLIRRAEKEGDPWSGHMAFPGGRMQAEDASPFAAAVRETQEEIDLDLQEHGLHIATLSQQRAMALGKPIPLVISPFVFELKQFEVRFVPNQEVAETLWIPLHFFLDPGNRTTMNYRKMGVDWKLPCYEYQGRRVWGLTLRMIDEVLARIQKQLFLPQAVKERGN